ncbi:hypothetical protein BC833DRAFT_565446 [Globomyces pollinis-pini]|nr:hypothetical protein BC833DRAFT_565446 [Globomyces pollinis-pini]
MLKPVEKSLSLQELPQPHSRHDLYIRPILIAQYGKISKMEMSRLISMKWKNEDIKVKRRFQDESKLAFERHKQLYPDFVWPSKSSKKSNSVVVGSSSTPPTEPSYPSPAGGMLSVCAGSSSPFDCNNVVVGSPFEGIECNSSFNATIVNSSSLVTSPFTSILPELPTVIEPLSKSMASKPRSLNTISDLFIQIPDRENTKEHFNFEEFKTGWTPTNLQFEWNL